MKNLIIKSHLHAVYGKQSGVTLQSSNFHFFEYISMNAFHRCAFNDSESWFLQHITGILLPVPSSVKPKKYFGCPRDYFHHQVCRRYDQQINLLSKWLLVAALKTTTSGHKLSAKIYLFQRCCWLLWPGTGSFLHILLSRNLQHEPGTTPHNLRRKEISNKEVHFTAPMINISGPSKSYSIIYNF